MHSGKLRYRTTDGALHDHRVVFEADNGWDVHVDPDRTLGRLAIGTLLLDLQLVALDESAPRHKSQATILAVGPAGDHGVPVTLG